MGNPLPRLWTVVFLIVIYLPSGIPNTAECSVSTFDPDQFAALCHSL